MTTQSTPRARVNMALAKVNTAAAAFFAALATMLITGAFLGALAFVAIPIGHHVWAYWSGLAASYQAAAAPVGPAKAQKK